MQSSNYGEIVRLLSRLTENTPDYPTDLLAARCEIFVQQALAIQFDGSGLSGKGGGDGGDNGPGLHTGQSPGTRDRLIHDAADKHDERKYYVR